MLTPRQKQILDFVKSYTKEKGYSPSLENIKKKFRLKSVSNIHQHIQSLETKGYLQKQKNQPRSIEISKSEQLVRIRLLGNISAGQPIEVITQNETIAVPKSKLPASGDIYALKVVGNSMIDENINDGDVILVKHQNTAENGQKVVALLDNQEATLKKFYKERGHIRLQPANRNMEPIVIQNGKEIAIQGIVLDIIKSTFPETIEIIKKDKKEETKKYEKLPLNKIILGDVLKELKRFPDKSIDMILTDPPYGLNKTGIKNDADLSVFYASLADSYRVLKDDSFYITFFSTKFLPKIFINNPFSYFWNFVLYCPNGQVSSPIGYSKYMSCTVFKKGEPKIIKRNKDIFIDTPGRMVEPDEGFINHPTPKPKTFISEIIKMFSKEGNIILDPFLGSGSTAMACKQTNRNYIGIEIDENYYKLANKRLMNFKKVLTLL